MIGTGWVQTHSPHPRPQFDKLMAGFSQWEKGDLSFDCWAVLAGHHAFHWYEPNGDVKKHRLWAIGMRLR
jgi:hypothetical protein